jgi:hypothetical protein
MKRPIEHMKSDPRIKLREEGWQKVGVVNVQQNRHAMKPYADKAKDENRDVQFITPVEAAQTGDWEVWMSPPKPDKPEEKPATPIVVQNPTNLTPPICFSCEQPLTQPGALLFGPPGISERIRNFSEVAKRHVCVDCYYEMIGVKPDAKSQRIDDLLAILQQVKDMVPSDFAAQIKNMIDPPCKE